MGRGGFPTSTDGFILGPSHGFVGPLLLVVLRVFSVSPTRFLLHSPEANSFCFASN
jgi:hypothetical protein